MGHHGTRHRRFFEKLLSSENFCLRRCQESLSYGIVFIRQQFIQREPTSNHIHKGGRMVSKLRERSIWNIDILKSECSILTGRNYRKWLRIIYSSPNLWASYTLFREMRNGYQARLILELISLWITFRTYSFNLGKNFWAELKLVGRYKTQKLRKWWFMPNDSKTLTSSCFRRCMWSI